VVKTYKAWSLKLTEEQLKAFTKQAQLLPRLANLQKVTLEHSQPPVFHAFVEGKTLPHFSTTRLLENGLREYFQIGPTLIKIWMVPSIRDRK